MSTRRRWGVFSGKDDGEGEPEKFNAAAASIEMPVAAAFLD